MGFSGSFRKSDPEQEENREFGIHWLVDSNKENRKFE